LPANKAWRKVKPIIRENSRVGAEVVGTSGASLIGQKTLNGGNSF
jgi:hypothetical protein